MSSFTLPSSTPAGTLMVDPEIQEIMDLVHNGYPPFGWAGDERLGLYRIPGNRWQLIRFEENGLESVVCTSRPGLVLDHSLILHLVKHDGRRGVTAAKVAEEVIKANEDADDAQTNAAVEALSEPMQKVYWNLAHANKLGNPVISLAGLSEKLPTK